MCASQSVSSKHREEVAIPLPEINGEKPTWQVSLGSAWRAVGEGAVMGPDKSRGFPS